MVMKKDGRKRDIKSKLVAAVCMLLVSCIMMVSSTYAWFTLSTAPEVTGITTAVGANGNLEMALIPSSDGTNYYTAIADALEAVGNASGSLSTVQANTTWGNLVDLTDSSYGLDKITLYPATMMQDGKTTPTVVPSNYLYTPQYGADGRFTSLGTSAFAAIHANGSFGTSGFGVRAVGTSSGMTGLEIAYRDALSAGNTAFTAAIAKAEATVATGGSTLASMAVTRATNDAATFTQGDVDALKAAYTGLDQALALAETALRNYILADYLSSSVSGVSEDTYASIVEAVSKAALEDLKSYANDTMDGYVTTLVNLRAAVSSDLTSLNGLTTADSYSWDTLSTYVGNLANINAMALNDHPMSYWMTTDDSGAFIYLGDLVSQMKNLVMEVNKDGKDTGYFAKLADFIDAFTTPVTINGISYAGISANGLEVTMKIYPTANPAYLPASKTEANAYTGTPFGTGGGNLISDFYGYIIDMAFRTNAAGSSLQIQTNAIDRVYADNESNEYTMGGGSTMTFTVPASGFSQEDLADLMAFIRVIYFDPTNNNVFCEARLDRTTAEFGTDDEGNSTVTMDLKKWDSALLDGNGAWAKDSVITSLDQNVAKAVSAMVYLEGTDISNADIANTALTGKMNLQFSSSAELNPMEYGDLRKETAETTDEFDVTLSLDGATQTLGKVAKGASYTLDVSQYTAAYDIVVKVNGSEVTGAIVDNQLSLTDVQGKVEIIATTKTT